MSPRPSAGASSPRPWGPHAGVGCYSAAVGNLRRHRGWFSRFALVALLGLALLPTLSRALAANDASGPWAELCSIGGAKRVAAAADGSGSLPAPGEAAMHLEHCPFCSLGNHLVALPSGHAVTALPTLAAGTFRPPLYAHAPHTLHAWAAAQPRGPPASA